MALLAGTAVVFSQLRYMQTRDLGFDLGGEATQLLALDFRGDDAVAGKLGLVKERLGAHPSVVGVASSIAVPAGGHPKAGGGIERPEGGVRDLTVEMYLTDAAFVDVYGLEIVAGRAPDVTTVRGDSTSVAYVLNETAVRTAGYARPEDALGRRVGFWGYGGTVVGVVRDFHTRGLQAPVEPQALAVVREPGGAFVYQNALTLRVETEALPATLAALRDTWAEVVPERPFRYAFLDATFARQYTAERRLGRLTLAFTLLALGIAGLGLFGLATHTATQRRKELGIRKTLGASVASLVHLLSKDFARLVAVAFVLAAPAAYLVMSRWLAGFAYRTTLGPGLFLAVGALALAVTLATVGTQAWRAARLDPVQALRDE
jgi:putative ABC transport system permease protein